MKFPTNILLLLFLLHSTIFCADDYSSMFNKGIRLTSRQAPWFDPDPAFTRATDVQKSSGSASNNSSSSSSSASTSTTASSSAAASAASAAACANLSSDGQIANTDSSSNFISYFGQQMTAGDFIFYFNRMTTANLALYSTTPIVLTASTSTASASSASASVATPAASATAASNNPPTKK